MTKNKALRVLLLSIGMLVVLLVAAAMIIPLVVDVDKYRPQIVARANERLNGKFELGMLKLSLWGQVRIDAAGLRLMDADGKEVLVVEDAYAHLPLISILSGEPVLAVRMGSPKVDVWKDPDGKLNLAKLPRKSEAAASPPQAQPSPAPGGQPPAGEQEAMSVPGWVTRSRLNVELEDALLTYRDAAKGTTMELRDFDFAARDLSLTRQTGIEASARVETQKTADGIVTSVKGPFKLTGTAMPELKDNEVERLDLALKLSLDELEILAPGTFEKASGVTAGADGQFKLSKDEARIEKLVLKFHNAVVTGDGVVSNLGSAASPVVQMKMSSNEIELASWASLLPKLKDYSLGGTMSLQAEARGPSDKLNYDAKVNIKGFTAKTSQMKESILIDGNARILTDQIERLNFTMKGPGTDLTAQGKLVSFEKPRLEMTLASNGIDLDQLLPAPPEQKEAEAAPTAEEKAAPPAAEKTESAAEPAPVASEDNDAKLAALRANPRVANASGRISFQLKSVKSKSMVYSPVNGRLTFKNLVGGFEDLTVGLWDGTLKSAFTLDATEKVPTYRFSANLTGLDLKKAAATKSELAKNTVHGKANFKIEGKGASLNTETAKANLDARGSMRIENARFTTIDVGKAAIEALQKAIDRVGDKIPAVKGKSIKPITDREMRYTDMTSDFTIAGGKLNAPNFVGKAAENQGLDIRGSTQLGLLDYSLDARWELVDTYNITRARDLDVEVAGTKVEHLLAEGNNPVRFPITVGCKLTAPCYGYKDVPEHLASIALKNLSGSAGAKLEERAKAAVQKQLEKIPPEQKQQVQKQVEDLRKKLFKR